MKTGDMLLLGALAVGAAYVFGNAAGNALPGAAANEAKKAIDSLVTSVSTLPKNIANQQTEQFFYNNAWAAPLVGHPEWAYMTPASGYW